MRIGSLFSGIGGLELGLEWAGLGPTIWQAERNLFCRRVLRARWPGIPIYSDVREVKRGRAEQPILICGGFPCQPVSYVGKGLGEADERWLWPECERVMRELSPDWCVWENVPGLRGRGLDVVLHDVAALGFDAEWFDLRASDVGAPHRRSRIFIVCHRSGAMLDRFRAELESAVDEEMGNADRDRLEGFSLRGAAEGLAGGPGRFPPGPDDRIGWEQWIADGGPEPAVRGGADGVPDLVASVAALGNAVSPVVTRPIGRAIMAAMGVTR